MKELRFRSFCNASVDSCFSMNKIEDVIKGSERECAAEHLCLRGSEIYGKKSIKNFENTECDKDIIGHFVRFFVSDTCRNSMVIFVPSASLFSGQEHAADEGVGIEFVFLYTLVRVFVSAFFLAGIPF